MFETRFRYQFREEGEGEEDGDDDDSQHLYSAIICLKKHSNKMVSFPKLRRIQSKTSERGGWVNGSLGTTNPLA